MLKGESVEGGGGIEGGGYGNPPVGVARPRLQGQAITNTDIAANKAVSS